MRPAVLILASRYDLATDYVTAALEHQGVSYFRLNSEELADLRSTWDVAGPHLGITGECIPRIDVGRGLRSVFVRRPTFLRTPSPDPIEALAAHGLQSSG